MDQSTIRSLLSITCLSGMLRELSRTKGHRMEGSNSKQQPKSTRPIATETSSADEGSMNPPSNDKKESSEEHHDSDDTERYQNVFKTYYARLCDGIPVEEVLPHLLSNDVITMREMDDILVEKTTFRQARALLNGPIWRSISGGYPKAFVTLVFVLCSVRNCEALCKEISSKLGISAEVMSSESREFNYNAG